MRAKNNNYMVSNFADVLGNYIQNELQDSRYYVAMANESPDEETTKILLQISKDKEIHAKSFMREYYRLVGKNYQQKSINLEDISSFRQAVSERIKGEINGFKTYNKEYINAPNRIIGNLFAEIAASKAEHAMLLLLMYMDKDE